MPAHLVKLNSAPDRVDHVYGVLPGAISDGALGMLAARQAAERRHVLDPALLKRGRKAAAGPGICAMIDAGLALHPSPYRASGNALIEQAATLAGRQSTRTSRHLAQELGRHPNHMTPHRNTA